MPDHVGEADEVRYENTATESWANLALDAHRQGRLQAVVFTTDGVGSAQVWGSCPRCHHELNIQQTLTAAVVVDRGIWSTLTQRSAGAAPPDSVEVACGCGRGHQGAPDGVTGCGVSFRLPARAPDPSE